MNEKIGILIVLIIGILGFGYFLFNNQNKVKNAPLLGGLPNETQVSVPLNPNHKGITNFALHYEFTGIVYDIQKVGDNTRFLLNIADNQNPDFVTNHSTGAIRDIAQGVEPIKISDITKNSKVTMFMEYNPKQKVWSLTTILVNTLSP